MATREQVIKNFASQSGKYTRGSMGKYGGYNLFYENQVLYSYGYHFPLAVRASKESEIPDGAEGFGCGVQYIINGDKYSLSTSSHQNECIQTLKRNVQIPFSALEQAWGWATGWRMQVRELVDTQDGFRVVAYNKDSWVYQGVDEDGKPLTGWMDEEAMAAHRQEFYDRRKDCSCAEHRSQHRLGAVLFTIKDKYFLSSFDELDRGNYFLCHVPGESGSVEEAYENLKPLEVRMCEKAGATILRQGDWFFYQASEPADGLVKWLKQQAKKEVKEFRLGGIRGTHKVTRMRQESPEHAMMLVAGTVRHSPLDGRNPEHKRLKLGTGKDWWIPVKNTSEAGWGARGNVD